MSEEIVIDLKHPIRYTDPKPGGEKVEYRQFVFKGRLKLKHLFKGMGEGVDPEDYAAMSLPQVMRMLASWANVPYEVFEEVDLAEDMPKIVEVLGPFVGGFQGIGKS